MRRFTKPFSHAMLTVAKRAPCSTCRTAPTNALHKALNTGCDQCHKTEAWKPATFDHNDSCVTCHTHNNFSPYTCYGCHEHTPAKMLAEHRKEGVSERVDNCVRCHRSAHGEPEGKGERGKGKREKD